MKLINTDGMAFLGPGSEWFWTALQFTALAITFFAIYRQLQAQHIQMGENTKGLRSQSHYNALTLAQRPWEMMITSTGLARVVTTGMATPKALDEVEWARCQAYMFMQFNAWEYFYYEHRDGAIPEELWIGADQMFKTLVIPVSPGYRRFWSEMSGGFDEPFRSYVGAEFAKLPLTAAAEN